MRCTCARTSVVDGKVGHAQEQSLLREQVRTWSCVRNWPVRSSAPVSCARHGQPRHGEPSGGVERDRRHAKHYQAKKARGPLGDVDREDALKQPEANHGA